MLFSAFYFSLTTLSTPSMAPSEILSTSPSLSSTVFHIDMDIFIHHVNSIIEDENIKLLQQSSLQYISSYVTNIEGENTMAVKSFIFYSQNFLNRRILSHNHRRLDYRTLKVKVRLVTVSDKINMEEQKKYLYEAIGSSGYTEIVRSSLGLDTVLVSSSSLMSEIDDNDAKNDESSYMPSGVFTVVVALLVFIVAMFVSIMINRRRLGKNRCLNLSPRNNTEFDDTSKIFDNYYKNSSCESIHIPESNMIKNNNCGLKVNECELKGTIKLETHSQLNKIPPMIVIDDIDDDIIECSSKTSSDGVNQSKVCDNLVTRKINVETSSTSVRAGSTTQKYMNFVNLYQPTQSDFHNDAKSPLSLISSRASIDESIPSSTPISHMTGLEQNNVIKDNLPSNKKGIDLEPEDDFNILFDKKMKEGGKRSFNLKDLKDLFKRNKALDEDFSLAHISHYESESELSDIFSAAIEKSSPLQSPEANQCKSDDYLMDDNLIFDLEEPVKQNSYCSNFSSIQNDLSNDDKASDYYYTFEAPTSGKLGIIIQSTSVEDKSKQRHHKANVGHKVVKIKGYSPLLGMVQPGDVIVSVDGVRTRNMNTSDITTLLATMRSQKIDNDDGRIKITVLSKQPKSGFETSENHDSEKADSDKSPHQCKIDDDTIPSLDLPERNNVISSHLIGSGMSDDDDSFHMMAGAEDYV